MKTKNLKFTTITVAFLLGLVTLMLSYFEEGLIALTYQLVSLILLSVSVILFYLYFIVDNKDKFKMVSVTKEKPKKKVTKENNEKVLFKNIVSIDLEEDEDELNSDEKKVIDALKENEGSIQQKDLTDKVFKKNKVKSHRVISALIKKDYLIKRNEGKTNKIFLKK